MNGRPSHARIMNVSALTNALLKRYTPEVAKPEAAPAK